MFDNAEFPTATGTLHCMIMVDEASRLMIPHKLFEVGPDEHRNCTGSEAVHGLLETWFRHYGPPASVRYDPEGAFRSTELVQMLEARGIEGLPCAAEAHGQIGVVERSIQTLKKVVKALLQDGHAETTWQAVLHACQAHNEISKVEGFSPLQWAFGRQPNDTGSMHSKEHDLPFWTSSSVPGSSMASNLRARVRAQQAFLKEQAADAVVRASNMKTRRITTFLPGDLVFFKRVKPPAQPMAAARLQHKLWEVVWPWACAGNGDSR